MRFQRGRWGGCAAGITLLMLFASLAHAQTIPGPFANGNSWWRHPASSALGINLNGAQWMIDLDGDGSNETAFNRPSLNGQPVIQPNLRMSPTRDFVLAYGGTCTGGGTQVYFFAVGAPPTLTFVDSACIPRGVGSIVFYDTGICNNGLFGLECDGLLGISPQRICAIADQGDPFLDRVQIYWFDLVAGEHALTFPGFGRPLQTMPVLFSPAGDAAMVQHDLDPVQPPTSDYTLVDLCPPPRLGDPVSSAAGGALFNLGGNTATAEMIDVSGQFFIRVTHAQLSGGSDDFSFAPCSGPPPPPATGGCCFADGSLCTTATADDCESDGGSWLGPDSDCAECPPLVGACCTTFGCFADLTEAGCASVGGAWEGPGTECSDCPPPLQLSLTVSGPTSAAQGDVITYSLDYANTGGQTAPATVITASVPGGTTIVSVEDGGDAVGTTITWSLGTVPIGANGSVSYSVRSGCGTSVTNQNARISSNGLNFFGNSLTTSLTAAHNGPVTALHEWFPASDPVERDAVIEHALTLTNMSGGNHTQLVILASLGFNSTFEAELDAAGGVLTPTSGGRSIEWRGPLPDGQTSVIRFLTRVAPCFSQASERFNSGQDVLIRNPCFVTVGTATPAPAVAVFKGLEASFMALNGVAPVPWFNSTVQLVRSDTENDVQIRVQNVDDVPRTFDLSSTVPAEYVLSGDPPFIPPTDTGAAWDSATRRITWSGTLAPQAELLITLRALIPSDACPVFLGASISSAGCTSDIQANGRLVHVAAPRCDAHLLRLEFADGIHTFFPGERALCLTGEIYTGFDRAANGDIYVAGLPSFRVNLERLELDDFDAGSGESFAESVLGLSPFGFLDDVVVDPNNGVIFLGHTQGAGAFGSLRRFDPVTRNASTILDHPHLLGVRDMERTRDGLLVIGPTNSGVMLVDPAAATPTLVPLSDPNTAVVSAFALDPNDDVVLLTIDPAGGPGRVRRIDRQTGAVTTLIPSIFSPLALATMTVSDTGTIYIAHQNQQGVTATPDGAGGYAITLWQAGRATALEWVSGDLPAGDVDGDQDVDMDDLMSVLGEFGCLASCVGDLDGDGDTDLDDLLIVLANFGSSC